MVGRKAVLVVGVAALMVWGGSELTAAQASTSAAPQHITISTVGGATFKSNGFMNYSVRFTKHSYTIASGGTITFKKGAKDSVSDVHTLTVVTPSQVPKSAAEIEGCLADLAGTGCFVGDTAMGTVVDVGKPGLDTPGDTYRLPEPRPGQYGTLTITVSAAPGTTLNFMCAVHPWMQAVRHVSH